jgi:hypothetical protein
LEDISIKLGEGTFSKKRAKELGLTQVQALDTKGEKPYSYLITK